MDIASGRGNWRQDRERESEGGKEGERDREVDDRGSGLSRPRRGSPARTAAAVQTHKVFLLCCAKDSGVVFFGGCFSAYCCLLGPTWVQ